GKAMEVRIVRIPRINAEARGPFLVKRTQRPVPARSAPAQRDAVGGDYVLERALTFERRGIDAGLAPGPGHRAVAGDAAARRAASAAAKGCSMPPTKPFWSRASCSSSRGFVVASRYSAGLATTWSGIRRLPNRRPLTSSSP